MSASRTKLLIAIGLAALSLLAIASPRPAEAAGEHSFCWGVTLEEKPWLGSECWNASKFAITAIWGKGQSHSVCVGAGWNHEAGSGVIMCSGGPEQSVYNETPTGSYQSPFIYNNAYSPTKAWGKFWD
jgi:hypothetical protein